MEDQIVSDMKAAMKAGDQEKLQTLRMIKTAIQMAKIDAKGDFGDAEVTKILQKESKKRSEAADMFAQGGNQESADKELREKETIDAYLPEQMSEEKIAEIVEEVISGMDNPNMGQVMGPVMAKVAGQADGGVVSKIVKEKLG